MGKNDIMAIKADICGDTLPEFELWVTTWASYVTVRALASLPVK